MSQQRVGASVAAAEPLWTVAEVAEFLAVPATSVYKLVRAGKLPAIRIGARLRFARAQVVAAVQSGQAAGGRA